MVMKKIGAVVASAAIAAALVPAAAFAVDPSVDYANDGQGDPPGTDVAETGWTNNAPGTGGNVTTLTLQLQDPTGNLASNGGTDWVKSNARVQVPVAINFVVESDGDIVGPSAGANITNFSNFAVHVANIKATPANNLNGVTTTFAETKAAANSADAIWLQFKPTDNTTTAVNLYNCTGNGLTPTAGQWNISASAGDSGTSLALTNFDGHVGGFNTINPLNKTTFGQIEWTIQAGSVSAQSQNSQG